MKVVAVLAFFFLFFIKTSLSQVFEPFQGKLKYEIYFTDSITKQRTMSSYMTVYTNDTLVRVESETAQFGKQVTIRHIALNKYYLLLELNNGKYAIQHQAKSDSTSSSKYMFKKRFGSKRYAGIKAKKIEVASKVYSKNMVSYYAKTISPKYLEVLKGVPGLPVHYFIQNENGMFEYKLIELKNEKPSKDLFGIPSDYQKVTFEEFISIYSKTN